MAGVSVDAAACRLRQKWFVVLGLVLAVSGELRRLDRLTPKTLFLVLTRSGRVWLEVAGFAWPNSIERAAPGH